MKSLNYFTRPQNDLAQPSCAGAIISLLTLFSCCYFVLYVVSTKESGPTFEKKFIIPRYSPNNEIKVYIDILFLYAPCAALRLQKEDPTALKSSTVRSGVHFERLTPGSGKIIPGRYIDPAINSEFPNEEERTQIILTGLKNDEQCRVRGSFLIKRTPGIFAINHELVYSYLARVRQIDTALYMKLNLAHSIMSLSFGNELNEESEKFNGAAGMSFMDIHPISCYYYLQLIPKSYSEEELKGIDYNFQYSYHRECYRIEDDVEDQSIIEFVYDIPPLSIVYHPKVQTLGEIFLEIAGLLCGMACIGRILNDILVRLLNKGAVAT